MINPRKPFTKLNIAPGTKGFLGCSSWGAAIGMSDYGTPREAFHRFIGDAPAISDETQEVFERGHRWEEYIAKEIEAIYGYKLRKCNFALVHPTEHVLICHPDRLMVGKVEGKRIGVEIKSSSVYVDKKWGNEDTDEVPIDYFIQCLGYMACGVCDEVHLFRCSNFKLTRYVIRYDEEKIARLEALLLPVVEKFKSGIEPEPSNWREVKDTYVKDPEGDMVADENMISLCKAYDEASDDEALAKKRKDEIRDLITTKMGLKKRVVTATGTVLHNINSYEKTSLDTKALKAAYPDIYEEFAKKSKVITFR